jgi:hypothetical protein
MVERAAVGITMGRSVKPIDVLKMMDQTSRLVNQSQVARAFEKQNSVARLVTGCRRQAAAAELASSQRLASSVREVSRTWLASQYKAQADFFAIGKSGIFIGEAKEANRTLRNSFRALDLDGLTRYVAATGTFASPDRDSRKRKRKATIVLAGRERRQCPYLAPALRANGWRVVELHPYLDVFVCDPHANCPEMLIVKRRLGRWRSRRRRRRRHHGDDSPASPARLDLLTDHPHQERHHACVATPSVDPGAAAVHRGGRLRARSRPRGRRPARPV